jgi:hypothetical protein
LCVLRTEITEFVLKHNKDHCIQALQLYVYYMKTKPFDSRIFMQDSNGFYVLDFQINCIALAWLLRDGEFAFLAKAEMFHAWLYVENKIQAIDLVTVQKLFQLMPFTEDFLYKYQYKMVSLEAKDSLKSQKPNTPYHLSQRDVHPVSWSKVRSYECFRTTDSHRVASYATYKRTLSNEILPIDIAADDKESVASNKTGETAATDAATANVTLNEIEATPHIPVTPQPSLRSYLVPCSPQLLCLTLSVVLDRGTVLAMAVFESAAEHSSSMIFATAKTTSKTATSHYLTSSSYLCCQVIVPTPPAF